MKIEYLRLNKSILDEGQIQAVLGKIGMNLIDIDTYIKQNYFKEII